MKKYSNYFSALLAGVALLGLPACSDTWDEHYNGGDIASTVDAPSLLAQVESDASLANYLKVLRATGYDKVLGSPQTLTIWAPVISEARANELIAAYQAEKAQGIKDEDNTIIKQFVRNHMALYNNSVSKSLRDTTIKMLNGKYLDLTKTAIDGKNFLVSNSPASNGIFYKVGEEVTFHPNIREYLELHEEFDSVASFIKAYDKYELNENQSVQMGLDSLGLTVYADSVMDLSNELLGQFGAYIHREDSSYTFMAPTNEVWKRQYEQFNKYFNYISTVNHRDSMQVLNTRRAIFRGLTFNNRTNNTTKRHETDSVTNTQYVNFNGFYGLNMFERPWDAEGIYNGLDTAGCSNGRVMKDTEGRIDPRKTLTYARYIMANRGNYYWIPQDEKGQGVQQQNITTRAVPDSTLVWHNQLVTDEETGFEYLEGSYETIRWNEQIKNKSFLEIASITTTGNAEIYYELPSTFSGVYYNVYAVMCPAIAGFTDADFANPQDTLPTRFQVYYMERLDKPRTRKNNADNPNEDVNYPASWGTALDVPAQAEQYKDGGKYFKTIPNKVCIVPIDIARPTTFSSFGLTDEYTMRYRIITSVRSSQLKTWTNKLRINRLIYIPFDTEEEAKNFDLSDLNDYQN